MPASKGLILEAKGTNTAILREDRDEADLCSCSALSDPFFFFAKSRIPDPTPATKTIGTTSTIDTSKST